MIKVFRMPWKLSEDRIIKDAILVPKIISYNRIDNEHIEIISDTEDRSVWRSVGEVSTICEVYADELSYHHRAVPISIMRYALEMPLIDFRNRLPYDIINDLHNKKDENQDYSQGQVDYIPECLDIAS